MVNLLYICEYYISITVWHVYYVITTFLNNQFHSRDVGDPFTVNTYNL